MTFKRSPFFRAEPDEKGFFSFRPTLPGQEETHRLRGQSSPGDLFIYRPHPCMRLTVQDTICTGQFSAGACQTSPFMLTRSVATPGNFSYDVLYTRSNVSFANNKPRISRTYPGFVVNIC